jgi:hypothetical protein
MRLWQPHDLGRSCLPFTIRHHVTNETESQNAGALGREDICQVRCYNPDEITVAFDDERLVADAGLLLPATLAVGLGLRELLDAHVDLGKAPGAAHAGDKAMTVVHSLLAGSSWIDDCDRLRTGSTGQLLGHRVFAPSTIGPFLRPSRSGMPASWTPSAARHCRSLGSRPCRCRPPQALQRHAYQIATVR